MNFLIVQLIGAVGFATISLSYFKKDKTQILFMQLIAYIMFSVHYYFLNGISGAICNLICLLALTVIYFFERYHLKYKIIPTILFCLVLLIVNIVTFQNIYSVFPLIASEIVILSFLTDSENLIRIIGLVSFICWLIYAIIYKSYVSIFFEIVIIISNCISIIKNKPKV